MSAIKGFTATVTGGLLTIGSVLKLFTVPAGTMTFAMVLTALGGLLVPEYGTRELLDDDGADAQPENALNKTDSRVGRRGST